jgi:hypothetical protein
MIVRTSPSMTADLPAALKWCRRMLERMLPEEDASVWCVRRRDTGVVVTFVAGPGRDVSLWLAFDMGNDPDAYTLTPMALVGEEVCFGGEQRDCRGGLHS